MGEDVYLLRIEGPDRSALAHIRHGALRRRPQPDDHLFRIEPGCGADRRHRGTCASPPGPRRAVRHGNRDLCLESRVHPAGTAQKDRRHYAEGYRRMDGLRRRQLSAARRADSDVHDTRSLGRTDSGRARRRGIGADGDKACPGCPADVRSPRQSGKRDGGRTDFLLTEGNFLRRQAVPESGLADRGSDRQGGSCRFRRTGRTGKRTPACRLVCPRDRRITVGRHRRGHAVGTGGPADTLRLSDDSDDRGRSS